MKRTVPIWMWAGVRALLALTAYSTWNSRQLGEKTKAANERATALRQQRRDLEAELERTRRESQGDHGANESPGHHRRTRRRQSGSHDARPLGRRHQRHQLDFDLFEPVPYRSSSLVLRRSAASSNRCFSSAVFTISGATVFGLRVCSSIATNVTYAVVVCFRSPVSTFSEWTSTPTSIEV